MAGRAVWKTVVFSGFIREKSSEENCELLQCRQSCPVPMIRSGWWTMASGCWRSIGGCIGKIAHLDKQLSSPGTASGERTCSINHTINHRIVNCRS